MYFLNWIGFFCFSAACITHVTSNSQVKDSSPSYYNYDVTSTDFLNTQTTKLCLLARLNISIRFTYKSNTESFTKTIFIPPDANNEHSSCNFDFVSILQLNFNGISFALNFRRNDISSSQTRIGYCASCENGNWWLDTIRVKTNDTRTIVSKAPVTRLDSIINGSEVSQDAGGFITGVSLKRGYRCREHVLYANLSITEALDLATRENLINNWSVEVHFYSIDVQPFLVTNDIVKDPLLCKDFTLFLILIILMPLLYFSIFITYYRLKERFGFPSLKKKWPILALKKKDGSKQLISTKAAFASNSTCTLSATNTVTITCTTSEGKETDIHTSTTSC